MSFSDYRFIFIFLPIFVTIYRLAPQRIRRFIMIIGSLAFYTIGTWNTIKWSSILLIILSLIQYGLYRVHNKEPHLYLRVLIIIFAFVPLAICKILGILPLGISFYSFQIASLQIDLWNRKKNDDEEQKENKNYISLLDFCGFIFMFPKLIMGPIARYEDSWDITFGWGEKYSRKLSLRELEQGLKTFTLGLALKVLLADQLATLWNSISVSGASGISWNTAWLGAVAYTLELYFDFWGYSLMAVGLGSVCGIRLPDNFNDPYVSTSVGEFWRRWHITLGQWFKDYIYIPLGGNRRGKVRTFINLFVVWMITGIWHGNGWNFVIWGLVLYLSICIERIITLLFENNANKNASNIFNYTKRLAGHIYILLLMPVTWMIFAHTDLYELWIYVCAMFGLYEKGAVLPVGQFSRYIQTYWYLIAVGLLLLTPYPGLIYRKYREKHWISIPLLILFWSSVIMIFKGTSNTFLYYQF